MLNAAAGFTVNISVMNTIDGKSLKVIEPDKDGVYRNVPVSVIGIPSRNGVLYEPNSFMSSLTNKRSRFYNLLVEGGLEGEWFHPLDDSPERTFQIDRSIMSHYIVGVRTQPTADRAYTIVYADIVPFGPMGDSLRESFADSKRHTAFSKRSLTTRGIMQNGILVKKIVALVTFDCCDGPGFKQTSSRYMAAGESIKRVVDISDHCMNVSVDDFMRIERQQRVVGMECITHQEVLDIIQADGVYVDDTSIGHVTSEGRLINADGETTSMFHHMFKG